MIYVLFLLCCLSVSLNCMEADKGQESTEIRSSFEQAFFSQSASDEPYENETEVGPEELELLMIAALEEYANNPDQVCRQTWWSRIQHLTHLLERANAQLR